MYYSGNASHLVRPCNLVVGLSCCRRITAMVVFLSFPSYSRMELYLTIPIYLPTTSERLNIL